MPELHHLAPSLPPALSGAGGDALPAREQRHLTILLVARLVTGSGDALARVRNVSGGGMMLETSVPLAPGDAVRVELRSLQAVTGSVAWATPPRAGIQFDPRSMSRSCCTRRAPPGLTPRWRGHHGWRPAAPSSSAIRAAAVRRCCSTCRRGAGTCKG